MDTRLLFKKVSINRMKWKGTPQGDTVGSLCTGLKPWLLLDLMDTCDEPSITLGLGNPDKAT